MIVPGRLKFLLEEFLRLQSLVDTNIKEIPILGLTATATKKTEESICTSLQIDPTYTIREKDISRTNITATISRDKDKYSALLTLIRSPKFQKIHSILVYCTYKRLS